MNKKKHNMKSRRKEESGRAPKQTLTKIMKYEDFNQAMKENKHVFINVNKTTQIAITPISETMALIETKYLIEWPNDYNWVDCTTTAQQMLAWKIVENHETAWID